MISEWKLKKCDEIILFNPKEKIDKNSIVKKVSMSKIMEHEKYIKGFDLTKFNGGSKFRNKDTLMARITPCLENGKTAQVTFLNEDEIACGSTEFIVLRSKENISDADFIYYLSLSDLFRKSAIKSMVGTSGRQRVQIDVLKSLELKIPSLSTQRKIGGFLSLFDKKIKINEMLNQNLPN